MSFFTELKRRNVIRMAGLYLVGAWLIVQVAETVLPTFDVPVWVLRATMIVLAIGFVPALVFAWIFELTPQGLKRDADVTAGESITPHTAQRMNRTTIVLLVIALGYFGIDKFILSPQREAALVNQVREQASTQATTDDPTPDPRSIAVLPFVNLSTDPENEFFSDGLSEEILNSLARIDGMLVVGRTSSFQFKGKNEDLRTIGETLGVSSVLEGSVRREGDRARITAQLVRASDGIHLWSQTYDRTLEDTLAVQLDIAEQVAGVLEVVLDDAQRGRMRESGVKNVDAFVAYQKGLKYYADAHSRPGLEFFPAMRLANEEFVRATTLDPDFSLAYFAAADLFEHTLLSDTPVQSERLEAQAAALKTLSLAAGSSKDTQQRLLTQAERQMLSDDWHGLGARMEAAFRQPGCNASNWLQVFASAFGNADLLEDFGARVSACDPLNMINFRSRATVALANGKAGRVLDILTAQERATGGVPSQGPEQALALLILGKVEEARRMLDALDQNEGNVAIAQIIASHAAGEDPAALHARLVALDRTQSRYRQWDLVDAIEAAHSGDRAEANRRAAVLDARPASGLLLAYLTFSCLCGAPFDLDATPNFKARLAESGLSWPPARAINYPQRNLAPAP